jgi:hypothetical protein
MSKIVALLVGGWSAEREVSLNKGKYVEEALKEEFYMWILPKCYALLGEKYSGQGRTSSVHCTVAKVPIDLKAVKEFYCLWN